MITFWLTVLATVVAGVLFGCTSKNARYFVVGLTAGMLCYIAFGGVTESDEPTARWIVIHSAIFLPALFATYGLRRLIRAIAPPNDDTKYVR